MEAESSTRGGQGNVRHSLLSKLRAICMALAMLLALAGSGSSVRAAGQAQPAQPVEAIQPLLVSGGLDTTFSGDGKVTTTFVTGEPALARNIAIQSNGRIVVVGDTIPSSTSRNIALARYLPGGGLDSSFSGDGKVVASLGAIDFGRDVAIHAPTGKIVVVGQKCPADFYTCDATVLRFTPSGALDTTFNGTGKRSDDFGGGDNASMAVALYPDGRIVGAGFMFNMTTGQYGFAVMRYTTGGALDTTFSGDGKAAVYFGAAKMDLATGVAVQADGKIVVGGYSCNDNKTNCNFALARLNENGTPDPTFSGDGKQLTNFGADELGYGLTLYPDGRVMLAGDKYTGTTDYFALARYTTSGALDTTFTGTGKQVTNFTGDANPDSADVVRIQSDGKIVVCGDASDGGSFYFALARYTQAGALDTTFSGNGKTSVDFGRNDHCRGLAIQVDGKYVVAGFSDGGGLVRWVVARVLP